MARGQWAAGRSGEGLAWEAARTESRSLRRRSLTRAGGAEREVDAGGRSAPCGRWPAAAAEPMALV